MTVCGVMNVWFSLVRSATCALGLLALGTALGAGCAGGEEGGPRGGGGNGGTSGSGGKSNGGAGGLCLLNNCSSDAECMGCSYGRTQCDVANKRCVACDAATGKGCAPGEKCTSFGTCAPKSLTCPTDSKGEPTISCKTSLDCAACDPAHQVCDAGKCVACTDKDLQHCLGSDVCKSGKCKPKCPVNCTTAGDCSDCDLGGIQAKACNNHVCAECSPASPCPPGLDCQKGKCVKPCGVVGAGTTGTCQQAAECYGCGNADSTVKWECKPPINGGTVGTCVHPAQGCSDLGNAVLPAPFDKVTNTCSKKEDCAGISADLNIGKLIRDAIGSNQVLGVQIGDAIFKYPMSACASVEIKDKSCGVCVPCKTDADCKPIPLDPLVSDLFQGNALAKMAAAFLMDKLYGKERHELHMQCQQIAAGYGACVPCANPTKGCGAGSSGQVGSGKCDHKACELGGPLDPNCGTCEAAVCLADPFCCTTQWDTQCKILVNKVCQNPCDDPSTCTHNPCKTGPAMNVGCSPCAAKVCKDMPYCCDQLKASWDAACANAAKNKSECTKECNISGQCPHSECQAGAAMNPSCSNCAAEICKKIPYCCTKQWDQVCANAAIASQACPCN